MDFMLNYFHLDGANEDYIEDEPDIHLHGLAEINGSSFLATSDYVWNGFYPDHSINI